MDSVRQLKYGKLIQKEIGEIFQKDGFNFFGKAFVTVTNAKVSPDLGQAKIYVSVLGSKDAQKVVDEIESHHKEIRFRLGNSIRHQARVIPELKFFLDDSLDYVDKMDKIFKEIRDKEQDKDEK
ncbi:MAG: hypothetical protein RIQ89_187 [Bacteroidota bacterium]|jgi:ribosome-binding factor A